jgi:molybdenum cofactor cytidylyltransferase
MNGYDGVFVLLAAGFSRRFGKPKLLHPLAKGKTVIDRSLESLRASGEKFIVAVRRDDTDLLTHLSGQDIPVVEIFQAQLGLSSVIAECCAKLDLEGIDWLGICLADMPYISPATFTRLAKNAKPAEILRPMFQLEPGHPVLFGSTFFGELAALAGDDGAKSIIHTHPDKLKTIELDDAMIHYDIDTPSDIK